MYIKTMIFMVKRLKVVAMYYLILIFFPMAPSTVVLDTQI